MRKGSKMTPEQCLRISKGRSGIPSYRKGVYKLPRAPKVCTSCGELYHRPPDLGDKAWLSRKWCSKSCALKGNQRTFGMFRGANNAAWKGGITPINIQIRMSTEMVHWRLDVFERDKYTCQACGAHGVTLQAHHILSFSKFPEHRFDIKNGMTLCVPCHKKTDNYAGRAKR